MNTDEQDREDLEVGRLHRERNVKRKELESLKDKRDKFIDQASNLKTLLTYGVQGSLRLEGSTLKRTGVAETIDWLSADELVTMASDIERLGGALRDIDKKLEELDGE